jgi:hypothetical protein
MMSMLLNMLKVMSPLKWLNTFLLNREYKSLSQMYLNTSQYKERKR